MRESVYQLNNRQKVLDRLRRTDVHYYSFLGRPYSRSYMVLIRWLLRTSKKELSGLTTEQVRRSLYGLEKGKYVRRHVLKDGRTRIELTDRGNRYAEKVRLKQLLPTSPKKWDGLWRFVMFDVPWKNNYTRDILRDKLKNLGFFRVQQSVWVFPYDCREELGLIVEFLKAQDCVLQFTGSITDDQKLRQHFTDRGFKL